MTDALELRAEVRTLRQTLEGWPDVTTWEQFTEAAQRVGPALRDLLQALEVWDQMHPADRAAVLRTMAVGASFSGRRIQPESQHVESRAAEILATVAYISRESAWPQGLIDRPERHRSASHRAQESWVRLSNLPEAWRWDCLRRVQAGADLAATVHETALAINLLRSHYGIDAAASS